MITEREFLFERFGSHQDASVWIGAVFDGEQFKWLDKSPSDLDDDCVALTVRKGALVSEKCSNTEPFTLCERPRMQSDQQLKPVRRKQLRNNEQVTDECDALVHIKDILRQFDGSFAKQVARAARQRARREGVGPTGRRARSHC